MSELTKLKAYCSQLKNFTFLGKIGLIVAGIFWIEGVNHYYQALNLPTTDQASKQVSSATAYRSASQPATLPLNSVFAVPKQFQGKVIRRLATPENEKIIALTFDDGPKPQTTLPILEILKKYNVKATFFSIGRNLQRYPEIGRKIVAEGHAIGNHTWSHPTRDQMIDEFTVAQEIDQTDALIYRTLGVRTSLFRPPGGDLTNGLAAYAKTKNDGIILWSIDSQDYRVSSLQILHNVLKKTHSGDIVLLHDGTRNSLATVQALPEIIIELKQQGYQFVTVPELLNLHSVS